MLQLNDLAFQNADVLTAIADAPNGQWSGPKDLARHLNRDDSNLGKTLRRLTAEGILADPPLSGLTEAGQAQLAAIQRARGEGGADRWQPRMIRRNPANRIPATAAVAALADTIEAAGDVLQPVILTPPDATDVRMLLAGEHRWLAVQLLAEQDRLPPALAEGLPFTERAAGEAEQILIRIVENSGRTDLSPLDDARQLLALQQATTWSAREIAKKTGRSPADSDTGVRDVQVKIRIAKEATAEALAAYELDGSWDRLRDSVTEKKPAQPEPAAPLALEGRGAGGEGDAPAAPLSPHYKPAAADGLRAADFGVPEDFKAHARDRSPSEGRAAAAEWIEPDSLETFAMSAAPRHGFPRAQIQVAKIRGADGWIGQGGYSIQDIGHHATLDGVFSASTKAFATREAAIASGADLIRSSAGGNLRGGLPKDVETWLQGLPGQRAAADPLVVNGVRHPNLTRANEARRVAGILPNQSNSGGGKGKPETGPALKQTLETVAAETRAPDPAPAFDLRGAVVASDLTARADRMDNAARNGALLVLLAAVSEIIDAADGHLSGLRRALEQDGRDLTEFEDDTAGLREAMHQALDAVDGLGLGEGEGMDPVEPFSRRLSSDAPFVPVRKSITPEHITCLEDGRRFAGGLRRHLLTRHNLTPEQYRKKWGLPADYPMVAPNHAKRQYDALRAAALRAGGRQQ